MKGLELGVLELWAESLRVLSLGSREVFGFGELRVGKQLCEDDALMERSSAIMAPELGAAGLAAGLAALGRGSFRSRRHWRVDGDPFSDSELSLWGFAAGPAGRVAPTTPPLLPLIEDKAAEPMGSLVRGAQGF